MKRWLFQVAAVISVCCFIGTAAAQWWFAKIVQGDVAYMSERIMKAPHEAPWPRTDGSFPYGIHKELGLHSKLVSIFAAMNQISAVAFAATLAAALRSVPKHTGVLSD